MITFAIILLSLTIVLGVFMLVKKPKRLYLGLEAFLFNTPLNSRIVGFILMVVSLILLIQLIRKIIIGNL